MARSESETQVAVRPYFGHLPDWIYVHPAYAGGTQCVEDRLTNGDRWVLHILAGQCGTKVDDNGSIRGCWCGGRLLTRTHCPHSTFWRTLKKLYRLGFVVKMTQGGGYEKANELGIPGRAGALDALSAPDDPRYRKPRNAVPDRDGTPGCDESQTVQMLDGKPSMIGTASRSNSGPESSKIGTQSSLSSSYDYPRDPLCAGGHSAIPTVNGYARVAQESGTSGAHDDDLKLLESKLQIELPDSADRDQMKQVLTRAGEDPGWAHQHAHHPLVEPGTIRDAVLAMTAGRESDDLIRNPGAYLGNLLDDAIIRAKEVEAQRRKQSFDAMQVLAKAAEAAIAGMSDAEQKGVIGSVEWAKGMDPSDLRNAPVLRKHLAETMAARSERESLDVGAVRSIPSAAFEAAGPGGG